MRERWVWKGLTLNRHFARTPTCRGDARAGGSRWERGVLLNRNPLASLNLAIDFEGVLDLIVSLLAAPSQSPIRLHTDRKARGSAPSSFELYQTGFARPWHRGRKLRALPMRRFAHEGPVR